VCEDDHLGANRSLAEGKARSSVVDEDGDSSLLMAASNDQLHADVVQLMVEYGATVDLHSNDGWNALTRATERGNLRVVKSLLTSGAFIDERGPNGATALNIACEHDQLGAVVLLVNRGADLELADDSGYTPLITAAEHAIPTWCSSWLREVPM
jgi:ankyrin repeat protein